MKRWTTALLVVGLAAIAAGTIAAQDTTGDNRGLRARIEERYDIVPLTEGIALTPKTRRGDIRLIEISNGVVALNGVPVSGRELRDRVGDDAAGILRLSYLSVEERREIFGGPGSKALPRKEPRAAAPEDPPPSTRGRRSSGERVRIFGDVVVSENETINGQVVAVLGSVRVEGEVTGEVVAVLGSVTAGPKAIIRGDVVSVGGGVRRAPTAQLLANVTEVSVGDAGAHFNVDGWEGGPFRIGFGALPRLLGSTFRLILLALMAGLALLIARRTVEGSAQLVSDSPGKAIVVGLVAEVLFAPVLVLTAVLLAISVIGIPLLLLLPFVVLLLILMAFVGFTGATFAVGQAAQRRFGLSGTTAFVAVCLGLVIIVSPLLAGRIVAFAEWPDNPLSWLLIATGVFVEFLAWTGGFGAVLMNTFSGWRARRLARTVVPAAPA